MAIPSITGFGFPSKAFQLVHSQKHTIDRNCLDPIPDGFLGEHHLNQQTYPEMKRQVMIMSL
jgi:hypothetical protein